MQRKRNRIVFRKNLGNTFEVLYFYINEYWRWGITYLEYDFSQGYQAGVKSFKKLADQDLLTIMDIKIP